MTASKLKPTVFGRKKQEPQSEPDGNNLSLNDARAIIDERTQRARKMVMPDFTPRAVREEMKKQNAKEFSKDDVSSIVEMDCKKHYKMWLLHKMGMPRKQIADLLAKGNVGYVRNEIIKYEQDPERENKFKV